MTRSKPTIEADRAPTMHGDGAGVVSQPATMEFLIFEANGDDDQRTLLDRSGNSVARSASVAAHHGTANAARVALTRPGSAQRGRRTHSDGAVDHVARPDDTLARDATDAERWLDEGGSVSRKGART